MQQTVGNIGIKVNIRLEDVPRWLKRANTDLDFDTGANYLHNRAIRDAAYVCEEIIVIRHGAIVERGQIAEIFANPDCPRTLLASVPSRTWLG